MIKGCCFGEVLWDIFPEEKKIGGAPLNVAFRLNKLGTKTTMLSAIGNDQLGNEIELFLKLNDIEAVLQRNPNHKTGTVEVSLNETGSANYTITDSVAWDFIAANEKFKTEIRNADFLIFGSLIARNKTSREALEALIPLNKFPIFDVNLRSPFYDFESIFHWLKHCKMAKFNEEELSEYCQHFGFNDDSVLKKMDFVSSQTETPSICLTLGEEGAILKFENQWFQQDGLSAKVIDTVGAGDSFLAALVHGLFTAKNPQTALKTACAIGAIVAEKRGANPEISQAEIDEKLKF